MPNKPPNIVYIYADDLGRGLLSCYGQPWFPTPNIDRLATEGMRFERAYGCAFCAPARASLLTGRHDCHYGGWTFVPGSVYHALTLGKITQREMEEHIQCVTPPRGKDDAYLPEVAKAAGYTTGQIGKLEWGFATSDAQIRAHGWDYHYGYYDHQQCHGFFPPYLFENGRKIDIPGNLRPDFGKTPMSESPENRAKRWDRRGCAVYSQDLFDDKIREFLSANHDRPFFLHHPSQLPHGPIAVPEIDPRVTNLSNLTDFEKEYASMVLRLDRTVGRILDQLEDLGIDQDTMVIFASDNGHEVYYRQPGRCEPDADFRTGERYDNVTTKFTSAASGDVFNGNDGMAGKKRDSWEGGVRIPFLVRWPGMICGGSRSNRLIANYDSLATFAELLGVSVQTGDGVSFLPELLGERAASHPRDYVVYGSRQGPALTTEDGWKLRFVRAGDMQCYQLFYLPDDPLEDRDLKNEHKDVLRRLAPILLRECDGNFGNGHPETHRTYLPGFHFHDEDCHWRLRPDYRVE